MFYAKHSFVRINNIHERYLPLMQGNYSRIYLKDANQKSFTKNAKNST